MSEIFHAYNAAVDRITNPRIPPEEEWQRWGSTWREPLKAHDGRALLTLRHGSRSAQQSALTFYCAHASAMASTRASEAVAPFASPFSKSPAWPIWFVTCAKHSTGLACACAKA
jgi:hypothetical protein